MNKDNKTRNRITIIALVACVIASFLISFFSGKSSASISNVFKKLFNSSNVVYTEERKSVSTNYNGNNPGAYTLTESGDWINEDEVEVIYNISTTAKGSTKPTDVILLVPRLYGNDDRNYTDQVNNLNLFIDRFLSYQYNKIKLVYYNDSQAVQLTDFTNDGELLKSKINQNSDQLYKTMFGTFDIGGENYYVALKEVETIMDSYERDVDRDVKVLLMATRYKYCVFEQQARKNIGTNFYDDFDYDTMAEGEYHILKDMYPYMKVRGVVSQQYERSNSPYNPILSIHELGYFTDSVHQLYDTDLGTKNPFIRAVEDYEDYEQFKVEINLSDNYDYRITNYDVGSANIVNNKLIWDSSRKLVTNENVNLHLIAKIKQSNIKPDKYYQISNSTSITSKFVNEDANVLNTNNTTVYKSMYNINYNVNCQGNCNVTSYDTTHLRPYNSINISDKVLTDDSYVFEGWSTGNKINMATSDITTNAMWTRLSLFKSMEGTVNSAVGHYYPSAITSYSHVSDFKVEKAYFINGTEETNPIPDDAIDVFDASNERNGTIIAWLIDEDNNGKYEYYVRSKGGVRLQPTASFLLSNSVFSNLNYADVSGMNTSEVYSLKYAFSNMADSTDTLLLEGFDTWDTTNVTDVSYMFNYLGYYNTDNTLIEIRDFDNMNFPNVTNAEYMFYYAGAKAQTVKMNIGINSPKLQNMKRMFYGLGRYSTSAEIDVSNIDTSSVTNMYQMWYDALENVTSFDFTMFEDWDVSSVQDMSYAFSNAFDNVQEFNLMWMYKWNPESVTNIEWLFGDSGTNAKKIELDAHGWNMPNLTQMVDTLYFFGRNADYVYINYNDWKFPNLHNFSYIFSNIFYYTKEAHIEIDNWDVSQGGIFNSFAHTMLYGCEKVYLSMKNWKVATSFTAQGEYPFYDTAYSAKEAYIDFSGWDLENVTAIKSLFVDLAHNTETLHFDISGWKNTDDIVSIRYFFNTCFTKADEVTLDFSGWNTESLTTLEYMIMTAGDSTNTNTFDLNLSGWDFSRCSITNYLFVSVYGKDINLDMSNCKMGSGVTHGQFFKSTFMGDITIDSSNWEFGNNTDISNMFKSSFGSSRNTKVIINGMDSWDVSHITNMSHMFDNCAWYAETFELNGIEDWNTSSVTDMSYIFYNLSYRNQDFSMDLSSWNVSNVQTLDHALYSIGSNATTCDFGKLNNWDTTNVTNYDSFLGSTCGNVVYDFGTLDIKQSGVYNNIFTGSPGLKGNVNFNAPISSSTSNFINTQWSSSTSTLDGSGLTLNYIAENEAFIDSVISSLREEQHIYKGSLLN